MATIGWPTVGTSPFDPLGQREYAQQVTMPQDGSIQSISVYLAGPDSGSTGHVAAAIYSDSSGSPHSLLASVSGIALPVGQAAAWQTFTLTTPLFVANGTPVWLVFFADTNNPVGFLITSQTTTEKEDGNPSYQSWDDPFVVTATNAGSNAFSIYATYNPVTTISGVGAIGSAETFGQADQLRFIANPAAISSPNYPQAFQVSAFQSGAFQEGDGFGIPTVGPASGLYTVSGVGAIVSAEAFGVTHVVRLLGPQGLASAETFGTTHLLRRLGPAGIGSAEAFGTTQLRRLLFPLGVVSGEALGAPTLYWFVDAFGQGDNLIRQEGVVGIGSAEAFGTPQILSPQYVLPSGISSLETFGTTRLVRLLGPLGILSPDEYGFGGYGGGGYGTDFGTPEAVRLLFPLGVTSQEAWGRPTVISGVVIYTVSGVGAIGSGEAFGTTHVVRILAPIGIVSGQAFGTTRLVRLLGPTGVVSAETLGLSHVVRLLGPLGIVSAEAWGRPIVIGGILGPYTIYPSGLVSAEAFGVPDVLRWLNAKAVTSSETFGQADHVLRLLGPGAIVSAETFGVADLIRRLGVIGVVSAETFGKTNVVRPLGPSGIVSGQAFGTTKLLRQLGTLGIQSAEAWGTPFVVYPQFVYPQGIVSAEVWGVPFVGRVGTFIIGGVALVSDGLLCGVLLSDGLLRGVALSDFPVEENWLISDSPLRSVNVSDLLLRSVNGSDA